MNPFEGADSHKWRRDTSWWDEFYIPEEVKKQKPEQIGEWIEIHAPAPAEHDYVLYTDGSGGAAGWGATAAIIQPIGFDAERDYRVPQNPTCLFSGSYGSTVQRQELTAFLDGIHAILVDRCSAKLSDLAEEMNSAEAYEVAKQGPLARLSGPDRVTILWYTDRANLAMSLLFDEEGNALNARDTERDLWLRWSAMARYVCVTPRWTCRNLIDGQKVCDALCTVARTAVKDGYSKFLEAAQPIIQPETWKTTIHQKALF